MNIVIMGPDGPGIRTQADILTTKINPESTHLSAGPLLRQAIKSQDEPDCQTLEIIGRGGLLEDALAISVIQQALGATTEPWVLEGFPRTVLQAEALIDMTRKTEAELPLLLLLELDSDEARRRLGRNPSYCRRLPTYYLLTHPAAMCLASVFTFRKVDANCTPEELTERIQTALHSSWITQ